MKHVFRTFALIFATITTFCAPLSVSAATPAYQASTTPTLDLTMKAGETREVTLSFKNVGTQTWTSGRTKTALYLYGTASVLGTAAWLADDLPAVISEATVKPGQTATARFSIKAPITAGTRSERFLLSYGSNAWMKGSTVTLRITTQGSVATPMAPAPTPASQPAPISVGNGDWKAELVDRGGIEWQLDPGGRASVSLAFKNTGKLTWAKSGKNYVSVYTGTNNRKSVFKDTAWKSDVQTVVLQENFVKPGEVGHFTFSLLAPNKPGSYTESFQLAAEDASWIPGGTVSLPVRITSPGGLLADSVPNGVDASLTQDPTASSNGAYKATLLLSSAKNVTLLGNGRLALTYGFKNTGTQSWSALSIRVSGVTPMLSAKLSSVRDESWLTAVEAVSTVKDTAPGEIGFIGFTLKAPVKKGTYTASFRLYANNQPVENGVIDIPITVTADGYIEPEPKPTTSIPNTPTTPVPGTSYTPNVPALGDPAALPNEPIIRVGLFATTDDKMVVRAVSGGFSLKENGNSICQFNSGETVTVSYDRPNAIMKAAGPRCTTQTTGYYVAVADDGISPLELTDFYRPVSWLPGANDNKFRAKLELRYAKATDSVWIINELPIEWYLKGIAETSNSSPQEYQRALLTAARTYAMYHVQRGTKHAAEYYTVDATYDQVYRGYGAEARDPAVVAAIEATRGQIVMYQGKLAITPYYSRSDGRTRSWTEVWGGGPYPWLVSVPVPWDNGRTLWGHGVGLSATGALGMAADGKTYDQILMHFYTGIELRRIYK